MDYEISLNIEFPSKSIVF